MTDTELKKLIEDCCNDIFDRLEPLANVKSRLYTSLKPALMIADVIVPFVCRDCDKPTKEYRDNLCEHCHKWHTDS